MPRRARRKTRRERRAAARGAAFVAEVHRDELHGRVLFIVDEARWFDTSQPASECRPLNDGSGGDALGRVGLAADRADDLELGLDALEQCAQLAGKVGLAER